MLSLSLLEPNNEFILVIFVFISDDQAFCHFIPPTYGSENLKITAPVSRFTFTSAFHLTFTANNDFLLSRAVLPALAFLAFSCLIDEGSE